VAEVAVTAVADDVMGEIGVAVVVPALGAEAPSLDELRSFAERSLARHKLPERLVVATQLPLTPMEKLDRAALARQVR
jgi:acyl-CoA synthetase (AMP-forming)/AMP-acid ligase II